MGSLDQIAQNGLTYRPYGVTVNQPAPGGTTGGYPVAAGTKVASQVSSLAVGGNNNGGMPPVAPAWLGVVITLVLIRILYERGAKID